MNIRPVRSEQEYNAALEQIEKLWGAAPGTPEGDELDVLLTLVKVYEEENHPVPPPSPVEAIKFVMEQRGMKQADLVPYLGSRSRVSEILNGKRSLTLSMIRALHSKLGIPAAVLIKEGATFPYDGEGVDWGSFPVAEIISRGWVTGLDPKTQAEEIIRSLAAQADCNDFFTNRNDSCLRQGTRRNEKDNPYSIDAWLLGVLAEAKKIQITEHFDPAVLDKSLISKVAHLSILKKGPLLAKEYLLNKGIKMVVVPHFKKTYLDGAVIIDKSGTPIIALSLRYDRLDNFWFTLTHELAHLVLGHVQTIEGQCIIDDLELTEYLDDMETEADKLTEESLVPSILWEIHPARETCKLSDVRDLARKAEVHIAIIAGRIRYETRNYRLLVRHIGQGEVSKLFNRSYRCRQQDPA